MGRSDTMNSGSLSEAFQAAISAAPSEQSFLFVVSVFAVLFLAAILRNGFDIQLSFKPVRRSTRSSTRAGKVGQKDYYPANGTCAGASGSIPPADLGPH